VFVFVFLDCCVVTVVVFFPFVLKLAVKKCLYVQVLWSLGTMFLLPLCFWPSKEKQYISNYTANELNLQNCA